MASAALDRANEAHDEALKLYKDAQMPLPPVNVARLSQEAEQIKEEVRVISLTFTTILLTIVGE